MERGEWRALLAFVLGLGFIVTLVVVGLAMR